MPTDLRIADHISTLETELSHISDEILSKFPIEQYLTDIDSLPELTLYRQFPYRLEMVFDNIAKSYGDHAISVYHKLALASFIKRAEKELPRLKLPDDVRALFGQRFERIVGDFSILPDDFYDHEKDMFCKDLGMCSLKMAPVGCEVTEVIGLGRRHFFTGGMKQFFRYLHYTVIKMKGFHPLYAIHLDNRHLAEFNPDGQDEVYVRVAEMLRLNPQIKGLFGVSWFFDPQVSVTSPRLAYLRKRPLDRGATLFRVGSHERDIRLATLMSKTRKRLYEKGLYKPTGYMMLWPRKEMIDWVDRYRKTSPDQISRTRMDGIIEALSDGISSADGQLLEKYPIQTYLDTVRSYRRRRFYRDTAHYLTSAFDSIESSHGVGVLAMYQKLAMAHFIRDSIDRLENMGLPVKVFDLYHEWFERIIEDFDKMEDAFYDYRKDRFCKDLAVCSLRLIPVGFLVEESGIGSKFLFADGARQFLDGLNFTVTQMKGLKPFYSVHLDMRYLRKNFTKEGWIRCYLNIADLLKRYPKIKGMIGGSWFYDPQLEEISPGLAHLREVPEQNGGRIYPIGTSEQDLRLAGKNSPQRTQLIMEGKYTPVHYIIVWPRKGLLAWAEKYRDQHGRDED